MDVQRPQGHKSGEVNEVAEWNGKVGGVLAKGGRIHWEIASSHRSQKERAGGEGSKGRVSEGRDSGSLVTTSATSLSTSNSIVPRLLSPLSIRGSTSSISSPE